MLHLYNEYWVGSLQEGTGLCDKPEMFNVDNETVHLYLKPWKQPHTCWIFEVVSNVLQTEESKQQQFPMTRTPEVLLLSSKHCSINKIVHKNRGVQVGLKGRFRPCYNQVCTVWLWIILAEKVGNQLWTVIYLKYNFVVWTVIYLMFLFCCLLPNLWLETITGTVLNFVGA